MNKVPVSQQAEISALTLLPRLPPKLYEYGKIRTQVNPTRILVVFNIISALNGLSAYLCLETNSVVYLNAV